MLRFRRYRVFLIFAALATLIIVRLTNTRDWRQLEHIQDLGIPPATKEDGGSSHSKATPPKPPKNPLKEDLPSKVVDLGPATSSKVVVAGTKAPETAPKVVLPDRKPVPPTKVVVDDQSELEIHPVAPNGRQEFPSFSAVPTTIHWEKQKEHFPVPTKSIIKLPTGAPVAIPKIQHAFNDETSDAKITREKRQSKVKAEFVRAWTGYKKNAWLHDELSPVTGMFRDPFCGWAATLVDALDTLWIMGLQEEFEEAAKAVDLIDFTTSPRADIPLFETTIRYMGGLLAAYDVSGAQYPNLLAKAVELGEILIGAFDTPNRMPMLYYRWKPTFASQPHRASKRSSLAELGSLAVEFTRLTQLTHDPRYYDAIARVTNALSDWQDRGTPLPGVFPENVDASGCNRTATIVKQQPASPAGVGAISPAKLAAEEPIGYVPSSPDPIKEPKKKKTKADTNWANALELQVAPGEPSKAQILGWGEDSKTNKRDVVVEERASNITTPTPTPDPTIDPITGLPLDIPAAMAAIGDSVGDWDCVPQGLEPASGFGNDKYSMSGGEDSTYEYFPKQFLLLGGLEDIYKKMYLQTIDAVRKWMLFRPMVPDNRDILYSGSVTTQGAPEHDSMLGADVEHLTCFIGGMVGMGAKIFGIEGDLEIAKKLADGCVWAYESTITGIMPEGGNVMPCKSSTDCTWNETAYYEFLDPIGVMRDKNQRDYIESKAARDAELEAERLAAASRADAESTNAEEAKAQVMAHSEEVSDQDLDHLATNGAGSDVLKKDRPASLQKRQLDSPKNEVPKAITHNFASDIPQAQGGVEPRPAGVSSGNPPAPPAPEVKSPAHRLYEQKSEHTEAELASMKTDGRQADVPIQKAVQEVLIDPNRPLNHTEYVKERIAQEVLPPGYVTIKFRKYILRPEAIESVWYMYRITGDPSWQDKGWNMFESIINATTAKFGHSSIYDVTIKNPTQADEMESFWLAETLKYFYLLYSTPDTISLDDWVLNTEAHPLKRPT